MKKIININLSGRVIPIEDAAYESLQRYIESLRRYFAAEEGRDEIINDIESRIAELMNDKVKKGADAVTEADIEEIISSMGRVEDFEQADTSDKAASGEQTFSNAYTETATSKRKGRMYRDRSDKILGGVCSGIANYMNVDPAIVRLLFAIITFGGFGFGIFAYILAWIILPAKDLDGYVGKRLFRNPEDRVLGGVAGGLAAYFNKDTWIIRLVFVAPLLLNILFGTLHGIFNVYHNTSNAFPNFFIGSFTGTFILIYIILWIVLPEAKSPFEKMEMRGEKVDVNRIRQNVQEGMSDFKNRAQTFSEEVKESAQQFSQRATAFANTRGRTFASEVAQSARPVASGIGHVIGVLFKAFFIFIFGVIAFALFVVVLVFTVGGVAQPFKDFMLDGFWQNAFLWGTLIFFLAVPLIAVITWMVRRLMKVRSQNRYLGWTFGGLWTLGWVCLVLFGASLTKDFRNYDEIAQDVPVALPTMNKMIVRVDEPQIRYSGTFDWINNDHDNNEAGWDLTEDSLRMANVKMRMLKSPDNLYHVTIWKYSRGRNRKDAAARAERLTYSATTADSALILGSGFGVGKAQKFRAQQVIVEIKIPVGKQIRFDESVENKLHPTYYRVENNRRWNNNDWDRDWNGYNDQGKRFDWESNVDYTMTASGELVSASSSSGTYEYNGNSRDSVDSFRTNGIQNKEEQKRVLQQQIEEQKQKIENEKRRLQELQNNPYNLDRTTNQNQTPNTSKVNTDKKLKATGIYAPVFSLIV